MSQPNPLSEHTCYKSPSKSYTFCNFGLFRVSTGTCWDYQEMSNSAQIQCWTVKLYPKSSHSNIDRQWLVWVNVTATAKNGILINERQRKAPSHRRGSDGTVLKWVGDQMFINPFPANSAVASARHLQSLINFNIQANWHCIKSVYTSLICTTIHNLSFSYL